MFDRRVPFSSRSLLSIAEEMGQLGLWSYDIANGEMLWSPGVHKLIGTNPATDKPSLEVVLQNVHPDDRQHLLDAFELSKQGVVSQQKFRVIHPSGYLRWLTCRAEILYGKDGTPEQIVGLVIDITEQQTALEPLLRTQKRLDILAEGFNFSFWSADKNGALTEMQQWSSLGFSSASEVMGWNWLKFVPETERDETERIWKNAIAAKQIHTSRFRLVLPSSQEIVVLVCAVPVPSDGGQAVEWIGVIVRLDDGSHSSVKAREIRAAHIRAARAFLDWSVEDLASRSGVSISSIRRMEGGEVSSIRERTLAAIETAFTSNGVTFEKRGDIISLALVSKPHFLDENLG